MKLVVPYDRSLFERLRNRTLCVRVNDPRETAAAALAARVDNSLSCVLCELDIPLERFFVEPDWRGIPIFLKVPSAGNYRNLSKLLPALKSLDLHVYLPCEGRNLISARQLSSVGINTGIIIDENAENDWHALAEIMTYALIGLMPHAPIEPFFTMANALGKGLRGENWGRVYFDDPSEYLHLDAKGRVALSHRELLAGDFIADNLAVLDSVEIRKAVDDRVASWEKLFLENNFCSRCSGWKLCRGKFSEGTKKSDTCKWFFDEMTAVVEQYHNRPGKVRQGKPWPQ